MPSVFRTVKVSDGACACPSCMASGPTADRRDDQVADPPDLGDAIRHERKLPAPIAMDPYDESKQFVPDPPDLCEYIRQHRKGAQA